MELEGVRKCASKTEKCILNKLKLPIIVAGSNVNRCLIQFGSLQKTNKKKKLWKTRKYESFINILRIILSLQTCNDQQSVILKFQSPSPLSLGNDGYETHPSLSFTPQILLLHYIESNELRSHAIPFWYCMGAIPLFSF